MFFISESKGDNTKQLAIEVTGAKNAGRIDSYIRAQNMGIRMKQVWMATLDNRTRDSHAMMDGEKVDPGKKFSNGCRYPGDPEGAPGEIYNCRCTLVAEVEGSDAYDPSDLSARANRLDGMTYEEWKDAHSDKLRKMSDALGSETNKSVQPEFGDQKAKEERPKFEFTPAKRIAEAQDYLKQFVDDRLFGAVGVSYAGVSLEVANEVNRTFGRFYSIFDVEPFGGVIAPGRNTKLGKIIADNANAAWSDIRRSLFLNRNTLRNLETAQKAFAEEQGIIKAIFEHPEKFDLSKATPQLRRIINNSQKSGRGTVPASIEDAINHELGHSLQKRVKNSELWEQAKNNMHRRFLVMLVKVKMNI